jgi:hypothetical protein
VNATVLGLIAGLALGIAAAFGGFAAFVIVLLCAALGLGVGRYLDGQLDLSGLGGSPRPGGRDRVGR